jgi:hypothetical protein
MRRHAVNQVFNRHTGDHSPASLVCLIQFPLMVDIVEHPDTAGGLLKSYRNLARRD